MSPSRLLPLACLLACRQEMRDQARLDPLEADAFFLDDRGARDVPPGAVHRDQALGRHLIEGRRADGSFAAEFPFPIARADLTRGEQRYQIHCAPCHGRLGEGDGLVVRRGYPAPPTFSAPRVRDASPGELFDVVTHGRAHMPDYDHIALADRWRIVAWVLVLRLAQRAPASLAGEEAAP